MDPCDQHGGKWVAEVAGQETCTDEGPLQREAPAAKYTSQGLC